MKILEQKLNVSRKFRRRGWRQRFFAVFWLLWLGTLLAAYYTKLWHWLAANLLALGWQALNAAVSRPVGAVLGLGLVLLTVSGAGHGHLPVYPAMASR